MSPVANQLNPSGVNPYANQAVFGQIIGRVNGYATHASPSQIQNLINNVVRRIYDRRNWYGNFCSGNIVVPGYYSTGTVSLTQGSNVITGNGTTFTPSMVGQQLRTGFVNPTVNITGFVDATHLTTDPNMPWGPPSVSNIGFFITKYFYSFPNIKYFYSVVNLQLQFRMIVNATQSLLNNWDPARLVQLFPYVLASCPPNQQGDACYELWPVSNTAQSYPYLAYRQPPNLVDDLDPLPPFIRSDIVELGAIAEALLYRPKANVNYSESMCLQMSEVFTKRFENELLSAIESDEGLMRQNIVTAAESFPTVDIDWGTGRYGGNGGGGFMQAMTSYSSYDDY